MREWEGGLEEVWRYNTKEEQRMMSSEEDAELQDKRAEKSDNAAEHVEREREREMELSEGLGKGKQRLKLSWI